MENTEIIKRLERLKTFGFNVVPLLAFERRGEQKLVKFLPNYVDYRDKEYPKDKLFSPSTKNIMIITGYFSNLTILDIDSEEGRIYLEESTGKTLDQLCEYIVKTTKGYQLFYKFNPRVRSKIGALNRIDILGETRLTYADPINPGYEIIKDNDIIHMPEELIKLFEVKDVTTFADTSMSIFEEKKIQQIGDPLFYIIEKFMSQRGPVRKALKDLVSKRLLKGGSYDNLRDIGQRFSTLQSVFAIVAVDKTIDEDTYFKFCEFFAVKIVQYDEDWERLRDDCYKNLFDYDPRWKDIKLKENEANFLATCSEFQISVWFEPNKAKYFIRDNLTGVVQKYSNSDIKKAFKRITRREIKDLADVPELIEVMNPFIYETFYINDIGQRCYNAFEPTPLMQRFYMSRGGTTIPSFISRLLNNVLPNKEHRQLFLHNLAYHLRYAKPSQTAIILSGPTQGTGKGILCDKILGKIYGDYHVKWETRDFVNSFNGSLENALCLHGNDICEKDSPYNSTTILNALKNIVAESKIGIHAKGQEKRNVRNHMFVCLSTNETKPFKLDTNENRRFNILPTSNTKLEEVIPEMLEDDFDLDEILDEELPIFMDYLASIYLNSATYKKFINTMAYERAVEESRPYGERLARAFMEKDVEKLKDLEAEDLGSLLEKIIKTGQNIVGVKEIKDTLKLDYKNFLYGMKKIGKEPKYMYISATKEKKRGFVLDEGKSLQENFVKIQT